MVSLITIAGRDKLLDATLKTGLGAPAWYVGLKDIGDILEANTMAAHAAWATITPYSNATNPALTLGAISGGSVNNSAAPASFTINAPDDIYGAFITDNNAVGGATGILFGGGDFASPRPVVSGDTLNVTLTITIT